MLDVQLQKEKRKHNVMVLIGSFLVIVTVIIAVMSGEADITFSETFSVIIGKLLGTAEMSINETIIYDIRLPRVLAGLLVGAGLSVAGVLFQSVLRNPLADPYTIGVSTGAAFGAVLAIYIGLAYQIYIPTMPTAFAFAMLTLFIVLKLSGKRTLYSSSLILSGIIVSAIFSAGIGLLKSLAGEDVSAMIFWIMGRLTAKSWLDILLLLPVVSLTIIYIYYQSDALDLLTLGRSEAQSLGVDVQRVINHLLIAGALLTAVCVATSGIIGFVGLVVPHMLRMFFSAKHRYLIPLSAIYGGLMLMLADNISRLLFRVELPVGVITTLIGGPFFIYIYSRRKGKLLD